MSVSAVLLPHSSINGFRNVSARMTDLMREEIAHSGMGSHGRLAISSLTRSVTASVGTVWATVLINQA